MRIARVVHGTSPLPVLALERDGAVYDAGELDRIFDTSHSPEKIAGASDFHTRAIAMGGAGLDALDQRLRSGDRPSAARLLPGTFLPLPPCDTDRALYVQMAAYDAGASVSVLPLHPLHRIGDARGLLGPGALVPFPASAPHATFEPGLAAVLGDDLSSADPAEAERAILGYTLLDAWSAPEPEPLPGWSSTRIPAQLGPVLVTRDEIPDLARLKANLRIDAAASPVSIGDWTFSLAASISAVSHCIDLRAGDVIGAGCLRGGRREAPFGAVVELHVERLGKLSGRPVRRGI